MKISRGDLVLIGLDLTLERNPGSVEYTREDLALTLDVTKKTLNSYLTKLKKGNYIEMVQKKFVDDMDKLITITPLGRSRLIYLWKMIDELDLTPERHNIPSVIKVRAILDRMMDPLEKLFFLSIYSYDKEFDLMNFLTLLKISLSDSNLVNIFSDMDMDMDSGDRTNIPFIVSFSKTSFHGGYSKKVINEEDSVKLDPRILLMIAETDMRQGKLKDAKTLYEFILSGKFKLTQNQWFLARIGITQILGFMGDIEKANEYLDETMKKTNDKVFLAYCKQVKAKYLALKGDLEGSLELHNSALRSFHSFGLPLMLSIVYNNRGTTYYRLALKETKDRQDYSKCEEDWKRARKYAREARSDYCEAAILGNLADISARNGNFELALNYLKKGMRIFDKIGDFEGKAMTHYNYSLTYLLKDDIGPAVENFVRSQHIADPLPSPQSKEEMLKTFVDLATENGHDDIEEKIKNRSREIYGNS